MKNLGFVLLLIFGFTVSCKKNTTEIEDRKEKHIIALDSTKIDSFFAKYPKFNQFKPEIVELYKKNDNNYIWYDRKGILDFAEVLYNRVNQIDSEGIESEIPYKKEIDNLFYNNPEDKASLDSELLISSMYFFYTEKVFGGIDLNKSKQTGWFLPREKVSYVSYLDTLLRNPELIKENKSELIGQYYNLRKGLEKYREIEKKGGWETIQTGNGFKPLKENDSSAVVAQVRKRLFIEGYLQNDNGSNKVDSELLKGIENYQNTHRRETDKAITSSLIKELNVPIKERIKTIIVNMERCRWISPDITRAKEFISVNIPSYNLLYIKDGKTELISRVVVGKELNKTVVFSGQMSYIAFSPYWNIPKSITDKEIKPAIEKNPNYLAEHNMEWNGNMIRQKPGPNNSLGKVKFMFPNSNNIYLHDTPAKSLFNRDSRAFSHGCIRVEKARELALAILKDDKNWNTQKIDAAMNANKEQSYTLKSKIPVYIGYFTAWADENGNVSFYEDIYKRDNRLADLLYES